MLKWWWLAAGAALSCNSPTRDFQAPAGAAGDSASDGGSSSGGPSNGGTSGGGALNGGSSGAGSSEGGAPEGEAGTSSQAGASGAGTEPDCDGCRVGKACVARGMVDPSNRCQVCDPEISTDAYSPNEGAKCGASATACSGADSCDASGVCAPNHLDAGTPCAGGACEDGTCQMHPNPFDCVLPTPPVSELPEQIFAPSEVPTAKGGTIADGRYTSIRIDLPSLEATAVDVFTFEFKKGYVQAAKRYWSLQGVAYIPEVRFAGSYSTEGATLSFDLERCDPQYDSDVPNMSYTATANGLVTMLELADGTTVVTTYLRE